jgi:hypothetical protein
MLSVSLPHRGIGIEGDNANEREIAEQTIKAIEKSRGL